MKSCPCHSGLPYSECCEPYHLEQKRAENALKLMRSRYSAYALGLPDYIIATTHPENSSYMEDKKSWRASILQFSHSTQFEGLNILQFLDGEKEAYVTFFAQLKQKNQDTSFQEKSRFKKVGEKWLYVSGIFDPNI